MRWGVPLRGARAQVLAAPTAWVVALLVLVLATALAVVVPRRRRGHRRRRRAGAGGRGRHRRGHRRHRPLRRGPGRDGAAEADSAADTRSLAATAAGRLPAALADAVGTPVAVVTTRDLTLTLPAPVAVQLGPTEVRLTWVARDGGAAVTWTAGTPPGAAGAEGQVQAGLAAPAAAALGVGPGDALAARAPDGREVAVLVSGVFTTDDPDDPAWCATPGWSGPTPAGPAPPRTALSLLLAMRPCPTPGWPRAPWSARSPSGPARRPHRTRGRRRGPRGHRAARRTGRAGVSPLPRVDSRLADLLDDATATLDAARAQAAVLVAAVGAATALVLLLAAAALVGRRGRVLGLSRARGGSLPGLGTALLAEGVALTVVGAGTGVLVGWLVAPGPVPWPAALGGVVPAALAGVLALPVLGVRAADAATGGRRVPLDARARTRDRRDAAAARARSTWHWSCSRWARCWRCGPAACPAGCWPSRHPRSPCWPGRCWSRGCSRR